jgi:RHS repeat-associated protein
VTYGYDSAGRLQTITQGSEVFTYGYDALSRRASLQRPNGVTTTYNYDEVSRLTHLTHTNAQSVALENYQYSYTADDEIATITSLASAPLLPQSKTINAADAANRITQFGTASLVFDNQGQTTSKTDGTGTSNYQWDARGRLTQVTLPNSQTVSYSYDALGRRASRTAGGATTNFLYDGMDVVLDRTGSSSVDYLNGTGVDEKLRQISSGGGNLYSLRDHLGSTVALTDSIGSVLEREQYEAFGASAGSALTRYGYTGRELDSATGLMYYRARWYDPQQGRFLSEDPIGMLGGLNLYGYVANNPLSLVDPMGLSWQSFKCGFQDALIPALLIGAGLALLPIFWPVAAAAIPYIGGALLGLGAFDLGYKTGQLINGDITWDQYHYVLGGVAGGIVGGTAGYKGVSGGVGGWGDFLADESGSAPVGPGPGGGGRTPSFLGQENGPAIPIPEGASGPTPTPNGKGFMYNGGNGGNGLSPKVCNVRIMDPTAPQGPSPGYPNGYVNYGNGNSPTPQSVNPYTGQTVGKGSPWWHIPLGR